jgi:hypothetical protein
MFLIACLRVPQTDTDEPHSVATSDSEMLVAIVTLRATKGRQCENAIMYHFDLNYFIPIPQPIDEFSFRIYQIQNCLSIFAILLRPFVCKQWDF